MKAITRLGSIAAVFTLALSAFAQAAPKTERASKYFTVAGTVLQINNDQHTFLVADRSSAKLYLVEMTGGAAFKITFGRYMRMREPGFEDVFTNERVEIRCLRNDKEHLALLPDGRQVIVLTAAQ
jgi:hypothetical protein